jgi:hypothetical protein
MAPEQALGERVNAAADVYALGATLATLLGGRAIGPAMTDEEAWARVVEARERGVSAAVAELIGACTCRSPGDRLRAADVAAAAGSLAFQKLSRGARATLQNWLSPLKPRDQEGSALDDLMGLCLVPVPGDDGGRQFTVSQMMPISQPAGTEATPNETRRTLRTLRALPDPRAARTSAPIEIQDYLPLPLTTGQKVTRAARWAATAIVVAAATFTAWKSGVAVHSASVAAAAGSAATPAPIVEPARKSAVAPAPPKSAEAADAVEPSMIFHRTPAGAVAKRPHKTPLNQHEARNNPVGLRKRPGVEVSADASDIARGWLRVGGAGYFGGRVIIDGEPVGFAPMERDLPVGAHSITVVSPNSGQTLVRQTIHVGGHHTHLKPLALLR